MWSQCLCPCREAAENQETERKAGKAVVSGVGHIGPAQSQSQFEILLLLKP